MGSNLNKFYMTFLKNCECNTQTTNLLSNPQTLLVYSNIRLLFQQINKETNQPDSRITKTILTQNINLKLQLLKIIFEFFFYQLINNVINFDKSQNSSLHTVDRTYCIKVRQQKSSIIYRLLCNIQLQKKNDNSTLESKNCVLVRYLEFIFKIWVNRILTKQFLYFKYIWDSLNSFLSIQTQNFYVQQLLKIISSSWNQLMSTKKMQYARELLDSFVIFDNKSSMEVLKGKHGLQKPFKRYTHMHKSFLY
ncbi:unnamed protein product [Paramecium octaurelia]|uniref:Uncharacterized protein n=1 Tax=Paramecium octaurelia TaxID=43137 RepID=A0A8S1SLJ7_PAROT|nr:unnamed protein product [Paramecium octaurelia]